MESLELLSQTGSFKSCKPYANYVRKRTRKHRCKQVASIAKQLKQLKDVETAFKVRRSAAIADAEVPSLVVQQYLQHEVFMESVISSELLRVLRNLESQLKFGLANRDLWPRRD